MHELVPVLMLIALLILMGLAAVSFQLDRIVDRLDDIKKELEDIKLRIENLR